MFSSTLLGNFNWINGNPKSKWKKIGKWESRPVLWLFPTHTEIWFECWRRWHILQVVPVSKVEDDVYTWPNRSSSLFIVICWQSISIISHCAKMNRPSPKNSNWLCSIGSKVERFYKEILCSTISHSWQWDNLWIVPCNIHIHKINIKSNK